MKKNTIDILLKKFPSNEYALMAEVRDAAGFGASRSADFLLMGLWPSRGLDMIGIERKSFRGDWLNELKKPEKAENIYQYCDRWYLLTDNPGVAKIEEIPVTWGWLHIDDLGKIKVMKDAPKLSPIPITKQFLACILKRAASKTGYVTENSISERLEAALQNGIKQGESKGYRLKEQHTELTNTVKEFEEASGIKINERWGMGGKKIGEALKFVLDGGIDGIKKQITNIKGLHKQIGDKITQFENLSNEENQS